MFRELESWFKEIVWDLNGYVLEKEESNDEKTKRRYKIYTRDNRYSIIAVVDKDEPNSKGYLGCTVTTRKPRPGEEHNRGRDLPDGKFVYDTWSKIVKSILRHEILKLDIQPEHPVETDFKRIGE